MNNRIAEMRRERGYTLEQLAERVGISAGMLSRIERGERSPNLELLSVIAEALMCDPQLLVVARAAPRPHGETLH